jgi:hypothetical protein
MPKMKEEKEICEGIPLYVNDWKATLLEYQDLFEPFDEFPFDEFEYQICFE